MCICCKNKLLESIDSLCSKVKGFKRIAPLLEAELAKNVVVERPGANGTTQDTVSTLDAAKDALGELFRQIEEGNTKPEQQQGLEKSDKMTKKEKKKAAAAEAFYSESDSEQQCLFILLGWFGSSLTSLFSNACVGIPPDSSEQKRFLTGLLRLDTPEAFAVSVLGALIMSYRTYGYGELPRIIAQPAFNESVSAALSISSCPSGGEQWRQNQFRRWKTDNLLSYYRGERGGLAQVGCRVCWSCAGPTLFGASRLVCSRCKYAVFCSHECFKTDWDFCHKKICKHLRAYRNATRGHNSFNEGMLGGMHASTYYKWKSGKSYWRPMIQGDTPSMKALQGFINCLDSQELPSDTMYNID